MWPIDRPAQWVGRGQELATLRAGVAALRRDEGAVVWVEGEPGIGKSSLVVEALAEASELGTDTGWGFADQLTERMPLSVMQGCLQVRPGSPDPRRARAAGLLRSQRLGLSAANRPGEGWARTWLIESAPALVIRAPQLAADLLRRELDETPPGEEALDGLLTSLVQALLAGVARPGG
jgi:predicted ATPase